MINFSFTFARGGSKGLPNKNILPLAGKPLLAHTIAHAQSLAEINEHFVSTDSEKVAAVASRFGSKVIRRPPELATDYSPEWLSWQHAVNHVIKYYGNFDLFISLPATSPLRSTGDIQKCISTPLRKNEVVITYTSAHRNPWFNLLKVSDNDPSILQPVCTSDGYIYTRRQDAPLCYDMTTVAYVCHPESILNNKTLFDLKFRGVFIPPDRALDIDTELEFRIAEMVFTSSRK